MLRLGKRASALALAAGTGLGAFAQAPPDERAAVLVWSSHAGALQIRPEFAPSPTTEVSAPAVDPGVSDARADRLLICEPAFPSDLFAGRAVSSGAKPETDAAGRSGR